MKENKDKMKEMFLQGMNYAEIGKEFGISKQRVHQLIGNADKSKFQSFAPERCVYDGLRKYLNENKISTAELVRRMNGVCHPETCHDISKALKGSNTTKNVIDKILCVTGLTYEEAFGRSDAE